jgi:glycine/D-amino acid oxidase-like deaminating enzyme/nitrite reductase/ring-hydroxylating ferredoxin subunit
MSTESIWATYSGSTNFFPLSDNLIVDVVIIGAGISGLTLAQLLSESGKKVAVVESLKVGVSSTGHSTGNLYETIGKELLQIRKKYSRDMTEKLVLSRREGINLIEKNVQRFNIDCDFKRVPWVYYSAIREMDATIEKEYELEKELNLPIHHIRLDHPSFTGVKAVKLDEQAQFNPLRYVQGLAKSIHGENCQIFEETMVVEVSDEGDKCLVQTDQGFTIRAEHVVHATHTPKGIMPYHNVLEPFREYGITCKIKDPQHPPGIYFGYYDTKSIISTRFYERDGEKFLIVVGSPHKVGHGNSDEHMRILEDYATKHFEVLEFTHRWGGQHYKPADEIPYIGKKAGKSKTFIATGYSTHGLTYGTVSAMIIRDAIMGTTNPYSEIYSAVRFTPMKSAKNFIKENATVFYDFVRDHLRNDKAPFSDVKAGEGKIIEFEGHKLAVYKDEDVGLKVCSAVCTHMACIVRWNQAEKSWDCPCHGSRFDTNGEVLEGPALRALAKAQLNDEEKPLRNPLPLIRDNFETGLGT